MESSRAETRPAINETLITLGSSIDAEQSRFESLRSFANEALPTVEDTEACNQAFINFGRPDLVISQRAEVTELPLDETLDAVNFHSGTFTLYKARDETKLNEWGHEAMTPFDHEDFDLLARSGKRPEGTIFWSHIEAHAYQRALILFPSFMKDLAAKMSPVYKSDRHAAPFKLEIFTAYQLMSRLVDVNDEDFKDMGERCLLN